MMMRKGASLVACRHCRSIQRLPIERRICSSSLFVYPATFKRALASQTSSFSRELRALSTIRQSSAPKEQQQHAVVRTTENLDDIKQRLVSWLQVPVGSWKAQHVAQGNYLLDACLNEKSTKGMQWATGVFERWIQERHAQNHITMNSQLVQHLHRVLHGWKLVVTAANDTQNTRSDVGHLAVQLLVRLEHACEQSSKRSVPKSRLPSNKTYSMVFSLLALQPSDADTLDSIQNLLQRRLKHSRQKPDVKLWQSCLNAMAKCSPFHENAAQLAEQTLLEMTIPPPNTACYASVLHAWAKSNQEDSAHRAQAILDSMISPDSSVKPNHFCVNTCINAWAKSGEPQRAQDLLERMKVMSREKGQRYLAPDSVAYSTVIHAWAKSRNAQAPFHASRLFEEMYNLYENGNTAMLPDKFSCSSVLDAWAKSSQPNAAQYAQELLKRMELLYLEGKLQTRPSRHMYVSVINAWANSRDQHAALHAEQFLLELEKAQQADTITYTAAIHAWSKSSSKDAPDRALTLLRRMQQLQKEGRENVAPNTFTLNAVVSTCANHGDAQQATSLLREMKTISTRGEPNVAPDTVTYASVINSCAKAGWRQEAMQLVDEMHREFDSGNGNVKPNAIVYTSAITAWENCGDSNAGDQAEGILWRMADCYKAGNEDAKPNGRVVTAVMRVWVSGGEAQAPEKVQALVDWMKEQCRSGNDSIRPSTIHYKLLLEAWAKSRRFDSIQRIESILNDMRQDPSNHIYPNSNCYNMLLRAIRNCSDRLCASRCLETLLTMIDEYRNGNTQVKPSRSTFHIVLSACSGFDKNDREEREMAARVLRETFHILTLTDEWERPSAATYHLLVEAYKAVGDAVDADFAREIDRYYQGVSQEGE